MIPVYPAPRDDAARFLGRALSGARDAAWRAELGALYGRLGDAEAARLAAANRCEGLVAVALADLLGPDALPAAWRAVLEAQGARVEALCDALEPVEAAVRAAGHRLAVVEAGGVMLDADLPPAALGSGDLDVLCDADAHPVALAALRDAGFALTALAPGKVEAERTDAAGRVQRYVVTVHAFARRWIPLGFRPPEAAWLARARPSARRPGLSVLAPGDALLLVAVHTSLHAYVRAPGLRLHVDADRLLRRPGLDPDAVAAAARRLGVAHRAFVSLAMAAALLDAPAPPALLAALAPPPARWRAVLALLGRADLVAGGPGGPARPLRAPEAAALELLLGDGPVPARALELLLPDAAWLRAVQGAGEEVPVWKLHARRATMLAGHAARRLARRPGGA